MIGTKDREGNKFVFWSQLTWGYDKFYTYSFTEDNYIDAIADTDNLIKMDMTSVESFYKFLNENQNRPILASIPYGFKADFTTFSEIINPPNAVITLEDYYQDRVGCDIAADGILGIMNIVNTSENIENDIPVVSDLDSQMVPFTYNVDEFDQLLSNYSSDFFPTIMDFSYRG